MKTLKKKNYILPKDLAKDLDVSVRSVWDWIKKGRIKVIKLTPRNFRITIKEANRFKKSLGL